MSICEIDREIWVGRGMNEGREMRDDEQKIVISYQ